MQSTERENGGQGTVNHPGSEEWMALLYGEVPRHRRAQLRAHLAICPECRASVEGWTTVKRDLNRWRLPLALPTMREGIFGSLRWVAAAAVIAIAAFAAGRVTSPAAADLASMKAAIAQLEATVHQGSVENSSATSASTTDEALRLLGDYAAFQAEQRRKDQAAVQTALTRFETGLQQVRTEIQTVAINTQTGFERADQNFTRLAAYTPPKPAGLQAEP